MAYEYCYCEGREAFRTQKCHARNPYDRADEVEDWRGWNRGWDVAKLEAELDKDNVNAWKV